MSHLRIRARRDGARAGRARARAARRAAGRPARRGQGRAAAAAAAAAAGSAGAGRAPAGAHPQGVPCRRPRPRLHGAAHAWPLCTAGPRRARGGCAVRAAGVSCGVCSSVVASRRPVCRRPAGAAASRCHLRRAAGRLQRAQYRTAAAEHGRPGARAQEVKADVAAAALRREREALLLQLDAHRDRLRAHRARLEIDQARAPGARRPPGQACGWAQAGRACDAACTMGPRLPPRPVSRGVTPPSSPALRQNL